MLHKLTEWFKSLLPGENPVPPRNALKSGHVPPRRRPSDQEDVPELTPHFDDSDEGLDVELESLGPGKNVLVRKRFVREETGTHEKLKILDDSIIDSGEETGLDPYNTGSFDRSKKWDQRFRK